MNPRIELRLILFAVLLGSVSQARQTAQNPSSQPADGSRLSTVQRTSSYDDAVAKARTLAIQKNFKAAATACEQAIQMDDKRWEAYVVAAEAYSGQQLYDDAIGNLQMALVRAPQEKKASIREAITETRRLASAPAPTAPAIAPAPLSPAPQATPAPANSAGAPTQAEIILWKSIENSKTVSDYQAYLGTYPNGIYASLASSRIRELTQAAKTPQDKIKELLLWVQDHGDRDPLTTGVGQSTVQDITSVNGCILTYVNSKTVQARSRAEKRILTLELARVRKDDMKVLPDAGVWAVFMSTAGRGLNSDEPHSLYFKDRGTAAEALEKLVPAAEMCGAR